MSRPLPTRRSTRFGTVTGRLAGVLAATALLAAPASARVTSGGPPDPVAVRRSAPTSLRTPAPSPLPAPSPVPDPAGPPPSGLSPPTDAAPFDAAPSDALPTGAAPSGAAPSDAAPPDPTSPSGPPTWGRPRSDLATGPTAGSSRGGSRADLSCDGPVRAVTDDPKTAWDDVVVDPVRRLPPDWTPDDLVEVPEVGYEDADPPRVRALVEGDLVAMHRAARKAGAPFVVVSAFRSEDHQAHLWNRSLETEGGLAGARAGTAQPGHSEHQLGTTVDVVDPNRPELVPDLVDTPAGAWLADHAVEHGFVVSYPHDARARTCYKYEPWHLRYVGKDLAAAIAASPLTPREYLLVHDPE